MREEPDGNWIVGRVDSGQFAEIPVAGVTFLRALQEHGSVEGAGQRVEAEHGEIVDAVDFVREIAGLGFIKSIEGMDAGTPVQAPSLRWLEPRHVRWVFRGPVIACVALFIAAGLAVAGARGELIPGYHSFFVTSSPSANMIWNAGMLLAVLALHEFWHLAAARAEGVPARIGLGTRLQYLVAQTTVSGMWLLPRRTRLRVYLAGVTSDLVILSSCDLALTQVPPAGVAHRALEALALGLLLGIGYQFEIHMRTDMYFVLQDLLRCKNLYADAVSYLRYRAGAALSRFCGRPRPPDPTRELPVHERRSVRIYYALMLAGSAVSLAFFAFYEIPIAASLLADAIRRLAQGVSAGAAGPIADGAAALVIQGGFLALFLKLFVVKHWPKLRLVIPPHRPPTALRPHDRG